MTFPCDFYILLMFSFELILKLLPHPQVHREGQKVFVVLVCEMYVCVLKSQKLLH